MIKFNECPANHFGSNNEELHLHKDEITTVHML